jgi:hypothetical protein
MATTSGSIFISSPARSTSTTNLIPCSNLKGVLFRESRVRRRSNSVKLSGRISAAAATAVVVAPAEEIKEFVLPKWADFDLGRKPIYWKTMNGLPPTAVCSKTLHFPFSLTNIVLRR